MKGNKRAQSSVTTFILMFLVVMIGINIFYTTLFPRILVYDVFNGLSSESKNIGQFLMMGGYPEDWDASNVRFVGIVDDMYLDLPKVANMKELGPDRTGEMLQVKNKFILFFQDPASSNTVKVANMCSFGDLKAGDDAVTYDAGYASEDGVDLFDDVEISYEDDIKGNYDSFFADNSLIILNNLRQGIGIPSGHFDDIHDSLLESIQDGATAVIVGAYRKPAPKKQVLIGGVEFATDMVDSYQVNTANMLVVRSDRLLNLSVGQTITVEQREYYAVKNIDAENFQKIVRCSECADTDLALVATWTVGEGRVYYISDIENEVLANAALRAATILSEGECQPVDLEDYTYSNLAKRVHIVNIRTPEGTKRLRMMVYSYD